MYDYSYSINPSTLSGYINKYRREYIK